MDEKLPLDHTKLKLITLTPEIDLANFDCTNADLNEFLKDDALKHQEQNIAQTTCIFYDDELIGFYALVCDALDAELITKSQKRKMFPWKKRTLKSYPAIKLARMALVEKHHKKGVGTFFIKLIKGYVWDLMKKGIGCRFITVDAYHGVVGFYKKNGFEHNIMKEEEEKKKGETVSMRLDILA